MRVALCHLHLHLAEARSLKEKRMVLSRIKGRLRSRFNVAVAEVEHQDLWQRAGLAVVTVGSEGAPIERLLEQVVAEVERELPGELAGAETEWLV